ncbi:MAG: carbamoyl phosphate synthase large subunit, partial [Thermodesulfovibrionia bacterium]|nr:carbamoyl phosphate synthase large subunit [Thermodesulfovibrionia bacterium]
GKIFISVKDKDKSFLPPMVTKLISLGFSIVATRGTALYLKKQGLKVETVNKVTEGRPNIVDYIKNNGIHFIINTVSGAKAQKDSFSLRENALQRRIPYTTTIAGAKATIMAVEIIQKKQLNIKSLQEYHKAGNRT